MNMSVSKGRAGEYMRMAEENGKVKNYILISQFQQLKIF